MRPDDDIAFLIRGSELIRGLDWFVENPDPEMTAAEQATILREWVVVKGLLWHVSNTTVDELFQDVIALCDRAAGPDAWMETQVMADLPPRFWQHYDGLFAKRFLVAMVDVTNALVNGWEEPPTVAHELATHILLERLQLPQEIFGIQLESSIIEDLAEDLFGDRDFDLLYSRRMDGIEDYAQAELGMVNLDIASWFTPFDGVRRPSPFATTLPDERHGAGD